MKSVKVSHGYSLLELIVSLAILSIIAAPLAGYFLTAAQQNKIARNELEAGQLAQRYIEQWKSQDAITTGTVSFTDGRFTVAKTAVAVTNSIVGETQPQYSSTAFLPIVAKPGAIEDYNYSGSVIVGANPEITITSTGTTIADGAISSSYLGKTPSLISITTDNIGIQLDATTSQNISCMTSLDLKLLISTDDASPPLNISGENLVNTCTASVYLMVPYGSTSSIVTEPLTGGIRFIRNIFSVAATERLYQLTVRITETGKTSPTVTLVSYKRME